MRKEGTKPMGESRPRPRSISTQRWDENWARTFGTPRLSGHAAWEDVADHLGGTYTPYEDGDGGTLYVADYLGKVRAMAQADGDPGDENDYATERAGA